MTDAVPAALLDDVRDRLASRGAAFTPQQVATALRERGSPVGDATVLAVHEALRRDVVGAGVLDPLLREPGVTDVLVNGADQVWVDRGRGLERASVRFRDDEEVRALAQRLVASGGRRLDDATPYADVRLLDGTRCHAVLAPVVGGELVAIMPPPMAQTFIRMSEGSAARTSRITASAAPASSRPSSATARSGSPGTSRRWARVTTASVPSLPASSAGR